VQLPNILPSFVQTVGKTAENTFNPKAKEFYTLNFQYGHLTPNVFKPEAQRCQIKCPNHAKRDTLFYNTTEARILC
jgi:hypothetical protein